MKIVAVETDVTERPVRHQFVWRKGLPGSGTSNITTRLTIRTGLAIGTLRARHAIRARLYRLCKHANVGYKAWRALRHHYALRLWQETGDPHLVADQLGLGTLLAVQPYVRLEGQRRRRQQAGEA